MIFDEVLRVRGNNYDRAEIKRLYSLLPNSCPSGFNGFLADEVSSVFFRSHPPGYRFFSIGFGARWRVESDELLWSPISLANKCRSNSKLPELVDLYLSRPLVTVPLGAKRLKVTPKAVDLILLLLGPY
ncbi:helix-turn-helix domain-containing protein (plasmid) [Microvirga sp. RSM25]|uniref:helix-turn-helix domain-containing protein n=1 Tax=Microvirga sp. RSM25 TaxID=3273802 RepID=UPI00384ABBED